MSDSKVKKVISNIITGGFEAVKDSAKQIADTVGPDKLLEQAIGTTKSGNEMSDYLKNIGDPSLTGDKLKQVEDQYKSEDEKKLEEARKVLSAIPAHMKLPQKRQQPSAYEQTVQEEERKKAQAVEAQKRQSQSMAMPTSKQTRGMLFGKKKSANKGFEGLSKDSRAG